MIQPDVCELLSNAVFESDQLFKSNHRSWLSSIYFILNYLNIPKKLHTDKNLHLIVKKSLIKLYKARFMDTLKHSLNNDVGKLRTYAIFKQTFCRETYFNVLKDKNVRICFTNLRISSHKLQIELGRYKNISVDKRLCTLCNNGDVEDEIHFVTVCNKYDSLRNIFYNAINDKNLYFANMQHKDKFSWLMCNEDVTILKLFAEFVYDCYKLRMNIL